MTDLEDLLEAVLLLGSLARMITLGANKRVLKSGILHAAPLNIYICCHQARSIGALWVRSYSSDKVSPKVLAELPAYH